MRIGIPREAKQGERRVALLPGAVGRLAADGHEVLVEAGAGAGVGADDDAYRAAGARIATAPQAWDAELVVKVKELLPADEAHAAAGRTLFSFQHLPEYPERTRALAGLGATAIAFEMVRDASGGFPLLAPMSAIAGRMAIEVAAGLLGREPAGVLVLGAGHAGTSAAREAVRRGARPMVLTRSAASCDAMRRAGFEAGIADAERIERHALEADVVVGAVFVPATPTPKLLPRTLVRRMRRGAVIVDVSIDAGGVAETSRATTHAQPAYVDEGVVHYCVPNMPAAAPREASEALGEALLPFVRALAGRGVAAAVREDAGLRAGVLLWKGRVNHAEIAAEAGLPYTALTDDDLR